jgi:hypothetical protein
MGSNGLLISLLYLEMERNVNTVKLYSLGWREMRTYLFAFLFIAGNIVLPQLCHMIPQGGLILLPIYFFTLIAAYKYGFTVGLLTAVLSPLVNNLLFGMPASGMLPIILVKSTLLALAAAYIAKKTQKVSLLTVTLAVVAYQAVGMLVEWAMTGSLQAALQDIWLGYPGIFLQIVGGWLILRYVLKD